MINAALGAALLAGAVAVSAAPLPEAFGVLSYSNLLYLPPPEDDYDVEQANELVYSSTSIANTGSNFPTSVLGYANFENGGSVGVVGSINGRVDASVVSRLTYWFRINSALDESVQLQVFANGNVSFLSAGSGFASGNWFIDGLPTAENAMFAASFDGTDSFSTNEIVTAQTNTIYKVLLESRVQLNGIVPGEGIPVGQGLAGAFVDPKFRVFGDGATLEFSDGITGASFVPEPGTWAIMLAGFVLVGAATRRQRARATP